MRADLRWRTRVAVLAACVVSACHRQPVPGDLNPATQHRRLIHDLTTALTLADSVAAPVVVRSLVRDSSITDEDVRRAFGNSPRSAMPPSAVVAALVGAQQRADGAVLLDSVGPRWRVVEMHLLDSLRAATRVPRMLGETADRSSVAFWDAWSRQFTGSGGYHLVSVPGLSADGREALVQVTHRCGAVCGSAWYVHLRRTRGGEWRVVSRAQRSVS